MADVEAGMEEILPVAARTALLDYKPGDVVVTPTGRGWHVVKVRGAGKKSYHYLLHGVPAALLA